jgi:hypothetical protein
MMHDASYIFVSASAGWFWLAKYVCMYDLYFLCLCEIVHCLYPCGEDSTHTRVGSGVNVCNNNINSRTH